MVVSLKVQLMEITTHPHPYKEIGGSWTLWRNLAKQSPEFGCPEKFYHRLPDKVGLYQQPRRQIT